MTHEKIVEFEKWILEKNIRDLAPNLDEELDKYERYIDNLQRNYVYGKDPVKDYEFKENIQEMRSFIAEISAAIRDDFSKAVKVLNKSDKVEDLEKAILDIAGAIDILKEGIKENKMNFSPLVDEIQKANYFINKERGGNSNSQNGHISAAG